MTKRTDKGTTRIGYINTHGQKNLGRTEPQRAGTDHCQYVYILQCSKCGHKYGSNGSDIFQRKCPSCQGGRTGHNNIKNQNENSKNTMEKSKMRLPRCLTGT